MRERSCPEIKMWSRKHKTYIVLILYYIAMATTIQVKEKTLERLRTIKEYSRESYDDLINRMVDQLDEGALTAQAIESIKRGLDDIQKKRTRPLGAVAKDFGVALD